MTAALKIRTDAIRRDFDAGWINKILNHPQVYPWVSGNLDGPMDMTPVLEDRNNYCLSGEFGALLFSRIQPGIYEVHSQCLPEGRGGWMLDFVNACLRWMFTRTDAVELLTKCPKGNLAAKALARAIHGTFEFTNPSGWVIAGETVPTHIYSLTIQNWMRTAPNLEASGQWFHDRLADEFDRHGITEPQHEDDAVHDRYVGATVEMMVQGQVHKAVLMYHRWAVMSGYVPVEIVSLQPLCIDIGNAIICIRERDFWVMSVKELN